MMKLAMSPAAGAVLRALISRSGVAKNRILLIEVNSSDWQSLTFSGERHRMSIRMLWPQAAEVVDSLCCGLEDAELSTHGAIVADITVAARSADDETIDLTIEALTIADD